MNLSMNNKFEGLSPELEENFSTSKIINNAILIVISVIVAIGGFVFYKNWRAKKNIIANVPIIPEEMPKTTDDVLLIDKPNGINTVEDFKMRALSYADELFKKINDYIVTAYQKEQTFKKLYVLNDAQLLYVYEVFNQYYYSKNNETMTQAIENEWNYVLESNGGIRDKLINRLKSLKGV